MIDGRAHKMVFLTAHGVQLAAITRQEGDTPLFIGEVAAAGRAAFVDFYDEAGKFLCSATVGELPKANQYDITFDSVDFEQGAVLRIGGSGTGW